MGIAAQSSEMLEDEGREADLALQIEHLERGLVTRTVIGQAQGILMERHEITADAPSTGCAPSA